jgi:hypothetical protein
MPPEQQQQDLWEQKVQKPQEQVYWKKEQRSQVQ